MRTRYFCALAVAFALAHLVVAIAYPGSLATGWLTNASFVSAALLCLWRAVSSRSDRAAWLCIGAGLLCQTFGDRYFKWFLADAANVSQPSVADFGYLTFYPLAACAIVLLLRARLPSLGRALVLDAAVGALAVLAIVAALVFPSVLTTSGGDLAAVVTNLAYPIADLILLGLLVGGTHMLKGRADRGLTLIAVALILFVVADIIYLYRNAAGSYEVGGPLDASWSFAAVAMGIAAWQTDIRHRSRAWNPSSRARISVVGATCAAIAVLVWDHYHRITTLALYLAMATIIVALARLVVALNEQKRAARALAETDATLRNVTETIDEVFWVSSDSDGRLLYVNPMYEQLYDRPAAQLYDDPLSWIDAVHPEDRERARAMFATVRSSGSIRQDFRIVRPDGGVRDVRMRAYAVRGTEVVGPRLVGTSHDVTAEHEARDQLAASEARYRDLALHDPLTRLANRGLFNDRLEHLLCRRAPVDPAAVIMVDLDDFKGINDTLGHVAGDKLLTEVASRLMRCTRPEDTVARLGGDEFSVLTTSKNPQIATQLGQRIAAMLSRPFDLAGKVTHSSASVGVAVHAAADETADALLLRADLALYEAKARGRAQSVTYDAQLETAHA
jgi:diguanylate cyclase (GGDEF)-like protein/PAS domain S-box-containing protein